MTSMGAFAATLADRYTIERELGQGGTGLEVDPALSPDGEILAYAAVDLWRDCDAAIVPGRNEIKQRLDALVASRG